MSSQRAKRGEGNQFPHMFSVTLNDSLNDQLNSYCQKEDVSKTQVVRFALTHFFQKYDKEEK